jgi:ribonuclease P protein component
MSSSKCQTLPRELILKKKSDIERVFKLGKRFTTQCLSIYVFPSERTRVAFLVNKKIGKAHQRNRMKRLVREAYRLNRSEFTGKEVIFHIRQYLDDFQLISEQIKSVN